SFRSGIVSVLPRTAFTGGAFLLLGSKYNTSYVLPLIRYCAREYTFGNESGGASGFMSCARIDTAESRLMPVSTAFTRLSSHAASTDTADSAANIHPLRLTETWSIP